MKCTHFVLAPIYTFTRYILCETNITIRIKNLSITPSSSPYENLSVYFFLNGFVVDSIQLVLPFFQSGKI